MNVLSLFDGLSGCRIALDRIGITPNKYYASEIDKYAIQVAQANYPNTIQLGSVTEWRDWDIDWASIDLVTGGFPCQAWSVAGKQMGDKDERGMLFWTMLDVMKHVRYYNPKAHFLIENVKMKKDFEQYITHHTEQALGVVHKTLINSALVSAQNRQRYYWTDFEVTQPEDKGIVLADIIEDGFTDRNKVQKDNVVIIQKARGHNKGGLKALDGKTPTLSSCSWQDNNHLTNGLTYRKLTPLECERLQTLPDNYTNHVSNTQRYRMIGNGWTIDVISHILRHIYQ